MDKLKEIKKYGDKNIVALEEIGYYHDPHLEERNEKRILATKEGQLFYAVRKILYEVAKKLPCVCRTKIIFDDLHKNEIKRFELKFGVIGDCWGNLDNGVDFIVKKNEFSLLGQLYFKNGAGNRYIKVYDFMGKEKLFDEVKWIAKIAEKYGLKD